MSDYHLPDHRVILQDSVIEISQLTAEVKELRSEIGELRNDFDLVLRANSAFLESVKKVQREVPLHVSEAAAEAFEDQLKKFNKKNQSGQEKKKKRKRMFFFL